MNLALLLVAAALCAAPWRGPAAGRLRDVAPGPRRRAPHPPRGMPVLSRTLDRARLGPGPAGGGRPGATGPLARMLDLLAAALLTGQQLTFLAVVLILVVRFVTGPLSYAANTPGGLFAPMLALGALSGVVFSQALDWIRPGMGTQLLPALMLVGMATLFTSVVRAPLMGAVLVMEMTATTSVAVAMFAAGATAVIVAQLCGAPPIYDTLRERMLGTDDR